MPTRTQAQHWLEKKQESFYAQPGMMEILLSERDFVQDSSRRDAAVEEYLKRSAASLSPQEMAEWRAAWKLRTEENDRLELPTRFENRPRYIQMMRLSRQIEESATEIGYNLPLHLQIGTLPTGKVNAVAKPFPKSGEYLVLFESGMFVFTLLLSKAFTRAMPPEGVREVRLLYSMVDEDWQRSLAENPEIVRRFQEVICAYLFTGTPYNAPQYLAEEPYGTLAEWLHLPTTLFVMGHEYGHIIRGHSGTDQDSAPPTQNDKDESGKDESEEKAQLVAHVTRKWQQEFEADVQGLELMRHATAKQDYSLALSYWGAEFFLICNQIVENSISVMRTGEESDPVQASDTHPPAWVRRDRLRQVLQNSYPHDEIQVPIQLVEHLERIGEALWAQTKPALQKLRAAGQTLSPVWTRQFDG